MLIKAIIEHIFGHRYYSVIVKCPGTAIFEVWQYIFREKHEAVRFVRERISQVAIAEFVEIISFRSHEEYDSPKLS